MARRARAHVAGLFSLEGMQTSTLEVYRAVIDGRRRAIVPCAVATVSRRSLPMTQPWRLRLAVSDDAESIATLHVASWRSAYRGIFSDDYLDGPVESDRRLLWQNRLRDPRPGQIIVLAEDHEGALVGFACGFVDEDPHWGSFVNNLHVTPDQKGSGIGRALMRELGPLFCRNSTEAAHLSILPRRQSGSMPAFTTLWAGTWSNA